jgi:methionyl-tRNA formyltransferase
VRTVFVGTAQFAVEVLRQLAASAHRPALVITRPDAPAGRGRRLTAPPVARAARELGIELCQPESINSDQALERIAALSPQALCVCAYGGLIGAPLLEAQRPVNVHPSLLPRWRGAAPIERALMAGDERTGVSIMRLTAALDEGPVCLAEEVAIQPDDTYGSLCARLSALGGRLLVRALDELPPCIPQDHARATYAQKITAQDRLLDGARSAAELERVVRALHPHIGALIETGGERLGVWAARVLQGHDLRPGVLSLEGPRPVYGTAEGALELLEVQPPGRRAMSGEEYLRGRRR